MINLFKSIWGYIFWSGFLLLCWFYIGLAFMWIGFYLIYVFGGLLLFSNLAVDRFTQLVASGKRVESRLWRWSVFPMGMILGLFFFTIGSYSVWEERPDFLRDSVSSSQVIEPHSFNSLGSFSNTWWKLSLLAENPHLLGISNPDDDLLSEYGIIHPALWEKTKSDSKLREKVITALKEMPKPPGNKNTNHYMKHFSKDGPIELSAGNQRLVLNPYPYTLGGDLDDVRTSWKLEDVIPNSGEPLPNTSPCYLKIICLGLD